MSQGQENVQVSDDLMDVQNVPDNLTPTDRKRYAQRVADEMNRLRAKENTHERDSNGRLTLAAQRAIINSGMSIVDSIRVGANGEATHGVLRSRIEHLPDEVTLAAEDENAQQRLLDAFAARRRQLDADEKRAVSVFGESKERNRARQRAAAGVNETQPNNFGAPAPAPGGSSPPPIAGLNNAPQGEQRADPNNPAPPRNDPAAAPKTVEMGQSAGGVRAKSVGVNESVGETEDDSDAPTDAEEQLVAGKPLSHWLGMTPDQIKKTPGIGRAKYNEITDAIADYNDNRGESDDADADPNPGAA